MNAIVTGDLNRVKFLTDNTTFSLLRKCNANHGPLHFAARSGNKEVLEYVINKMYSKGADIQQEMFKTSSAGLSVLEVAARGFNENDKNNNFDMLKYLITNYFYNTDMLYGRSNVGYNALHGACTLHIYNLTQKRLDERNKCQFKVNDLAIGVDITKVREQTITKNLSHKVRFSPDTNVRYDTNDLKSHCKEMISDILCIISNTKDKFSAFKQSKERLDEYYEGKKYNGLSYKMETPLAVAIRFGNVSAVNVLLEYDGLFDLTAFQSIYRLKSSNYANLPSVAQNKNRYIAIENLLTEKQFIKNGENGELVPCDVDKLLSNTSTVLDAVDMQNYIRAKDVYDKKYGYDSRGRANTGMTNVSTTESLSNEVKKNKELTTYSISPVHPSVF